MDLHAKYPAISDLEKRAKKRLPHFVWEFLHSGTGAESVRARDALAFESVRLKTSILHGAQEPDLSTSLLGQNLPLPFGIAPVGMSGLVWPDAERHLARAAARAGIPYTLSTVAAQTPEAVGPLAGDHAWFQLYPPRDMDILKDMLTRVRQAGFKGLVLTVDVPVASRRERQVRSGLTHPPRLSARLLAQVACRPTWAMGMARMGMPRMRFIDAYMPDTKGLPAHSHAGYLLRTSPDWDYLKALRDAWDGPLLIKGVLNADDVPALEQAGVDAIWISNHGGRQFDGATASLTALPAIRATTTLPLLLDSGVTGGLDILRAIAVGVDFVMLGRAWHYALAALGPKGPDHLVDMLRADLVANMGQMGLTSLLAARNRIIPPG